MNDTAILLPPGTASQSQNRLLFRIYLIYRTILSIVFLFLLAMPATRQLVGSQNPMLYTAVSIIFLFSNVTLLGVVAARWQNSNARLVLLFFVDIVCITLLSDASGGMGSGLPLLLTVTVASSAILISNRTVATLVAALTVLAILLDTLRLVSTGQLTVEAFFPAGLLGILFFVVSGIVQLIMNGAAGRMLDPSRPVALEQGRPIDEYSAELTQRLETYRATGRQNGVPFTVGASDVELLARFQALEDERLQVLVFLEDYRPVAAYAQSLKLTSLGSLAASIAHEIRNPLGAISHATQLLQESDTLDKHDRRMVELVLTNSQRVNDIVESVLQISRREPPRPEEIVLADWIPDYSEHYRTAREEPGTLVVEYVDPLACVRFDPEHLQRILDNLIDNAMRHTRDARGKSRAELRVRVDRGHGECIIDVMDDGSGVDPGDIARLFEPFFTRSASGTGLGLHLCRELCELNEARITYAPTTDGRSRFQITIQQQE